MSYPAPVLDYDVLGTVVEHAKTKTLLSLMLCCRTLYEDGVRVLLAEPVRIDSSDPKEDRVVWSFLEFMSADGGRRWQSLRGLLFGRARLFFRTAAQLAEGIKKAPNIEYLDLGYHEDGVLRYPELRAALATLENVKHITLSQVVKEGTYLFLESVRWPLVSAKIYGCTLNYMENISAKMHPAALLRCAQNTLIRVHWNYQLGRFNHPSGNPIYPNVKSLKISNMTPTPHEWVKAYPNLSQLSVSMMSLDRGDAGAGAPPARERNIHALADQCWPRLETCHAHRVADLHALGLPCHIRAVKIVQLMAWRDLPSFPETMEYARPVELELFSYGAYITELRTFEQAANGLRDLEQLCLTLRFASESIYMDIPRSLVRAIVSLSADGNLSADDVGLLPKLRKLALQIDCRLSSKWETMRRFENRKPRVEDRNPPPLSEFSLITFDLREFYRALFSLAPSLETVGLQINGMPERMSPHQEKR